MATQRWPTAWLLTDERLGTKLDGALERAAAAGAGVLVRHHRSKVAVRRHLAERVLQLGATLGIARDVALAKELSAALIHNPAEPPGDLPFSLSVHDDAEALPARDQGAALVFISPVYPTNSHPGASVLGEEGAVRLAQLVNCPAFALGGMDQARAAPLMARGFSGWAGIDCWTR